MSKILRYWKCRECGAENSTSSDLTNLSREMRCGRCGQEHVVLPNLARLPARSAWSIGATDIPADQVAGRRSSILGPLATRR